MGYAVRELRQSPCCTGLLLPWMKRLNRESVLSAKAQEARDGIIAECKRYLPDAYVHGIEKSMKEVTASDRKKIAPHLLYISFPATNHLYLATLLDTNGFAVSTGSACSEETGGTALRVGVLPATTQRSVKALVQCIRQQLPLARAL